MTNSFARSPAAAIGALLAMATIPLHLLLSKTQSEKFAAELIAVTSAIYVGFSLQKGNLAQIATELTVATGIHCRCLGGPLGQLRGSFRLPGSRMEFAGLCAPPRFKAFIHTLKARRHTLMVSSHCAPSSTGWWRRPWWLCGACVSNNDAKCGSPFETNWPTENRLP